MNQIIILIALLLAPLTALKAQTDLTHWKEDFSDEAAIKKNWSKYDSLRPGGDSPQRFWQMADGVMRGSAFWKIHPVGIMRKVSGKDVRLKCRIKLDEGAVIYANFSGMNNGSNTVDPMLGIHFRRAGLKIGPASISFFDDHYVLPEAGTPYTKGMDLSKSQMTAQKISLSVNEWHDLVIEMRGKELTTRIDGGQVMTHQTHSGEEPKMSISLSVGNESKTESPEVAGRLDDLMFEPIEEAKK